MYICDTCGEVREELDTHTYYDRVAGNSMMSGYTTEIDDSCSCGGTFVEAVECPICGDWANPDENEGIHEECYKEKCHDLETVVKYAGDDLYTLLTEYVFSQEETIAILLKAVREAYALPTDKSRIDNALERFTDEDKSDFAEWVGKGQQ